MRQHTPLSDKEHIIDLILLALTLVSVQLFYDTLVSSPLGVIFLFLFIAAGIFYTSVMSVTISLQRYETAYTKLSWNSRLELVQFILFLAVSILFWEVFIQTIVGTQLYKNLIGSDDQQWVGPILMASYPVVMVVLMAFSKHLERRIENVDLKVSPENFIIIRGKVDSTQMLFINIYNDSKIILKKINIQVSFPDGTVYWVDTVKGNPTNKKFIDSPSSLGSNSSKEYRFIPIYIGLGDRSGGLIRIQVKTELGILERTIPVDLREPSESIEDAQQ